jgi:hypothetical protein
MSRHFAAKKFRLWNRPFAQSPIRRFDDHAAPFAISYLLFTIREAS